MTQDTHYSDLASSNDESAHKSSKDPSLHIGLSSKPFSEQYRNHLLLFRDQEQLCIGEVFKHAERIAYCESVDMDSARQYCRQIVDQQLFDQISTNSNPLPSIDNIMNAMKSIQEFIEQPFSQIIKAHLLEKNQAISLTKLKNLGQFRSTTAVLLKYADLARQLCDELTYQPPSQSSGQDPYLNMLINIQEPDFDESNGVSISLKPQIFDALLQLRTHYI